MVSPTSGRPDRPGVRGRLDRLLLTPVGLIVLLIAAMWTIEVLDTFVLADRLQGGGIHPRESDGIDGIAWAPLLHADFGHLASNTMPFAVLGALVAIPGRRYWVRVVVVAWILGGALTWALAADGNHLGASGVVFGFLGALFGAAVFERRPRAMATALIAILLYSGMLAGLVPQGRISWEGHLFGFLAGGLAAWVMAERPEPVERVDDMQPWEADEPWLEEPPA